jgi:hypothetical protein
MGSHAQICFGRSDFDHTGITAGVEEDVTDFGLREFTDWRKRRLALPGLVYEGLGGWANRFDDTCGEKAAAGASEHTGDPVTKRNSRESRLSVSDLHHGGPRLIRRQWRRNLVGTRDLEIHRAEVSKNVFARHKP